MNDLELLIPNSMKINRGKISKEEIFRIAKTLAVRYLIIVDSLNGNPSRLLVYDIQNNFLKYSITLKGVSTLSDFNIRRKRITNNFCPDKIECKDVLSLFIDLDLISLTRCDYFINIIKKQEYCEVTFTDKFQKYVGPIIRINDFNFNTTTRNG
ncbi:hypothetical protein DFR86_06715 [Acidianus sulfidivorans JP7]|nr:hypothetical protein DFR86_06715 [Acidianus sulfidivorans JP7]